MTPSGVTVVLTAGHKGGIELDPVHLSFFAVLA